MNSEIFAAIWRASTKDRGLSREELSKVAIDKAAEFAHTSKLGLRAEGHFMFGVSQIWQAKAQQLRADSEHTDEGLSEAFREYLAAINNQQDSRLDIGDFSLDDLEIPQSLLGNSALRASAPLVPGDMSIDDVMRDEDEPVDLEPDLIARTAEEQVDLEGLDLGFDDSLSQGPAELDFGPELDYSSSPPHTPQGDQDDFELQIGGSSPKQHRPVKKRRGAALDDITTQPRPMKASDAILRAIPGVDNESLEGNAEFALETDDYDIYIATDKVTERFLDPNFVFAEMKRRRQPQMSQSQIEHRNTEEQEVAENSEANKDEDHYDLDMDVDFDMSFESLEVEDTQEMLETEQRNAQNLIKSSLKNKFDHVKFDELSTEPKTRACLLMEVLTLAAKGKIRATQENAYGPIQLVRA